MSWPAHKIWTLKLDISKVHWTWRLGRFQFLRTLEQNFSRGDWSIILSEILQENQLSGWVNWSHSSRLTLIALEATFCFCLCQSKVGMAIFDWFYETKYFLFKINLATVFDCLNWKIMLFYVEILILYYFMAPMFSWKYWNVNLMLLTFNWKPRLLLFNDLWLNFVTFILPSVVSTRVPNLGGLHNQKKSTVGFRCLFDIVLWIQCCSNFHFTKPCVSTIIFSCLKIHDMYFSNIKFSFCQPKYVLNPAKANPNKTSLLEVAYFGCSYCQMSQKAINSR